MEERLISFETAKLAKEKGFEIKCNHYYFDDGKLIQHRTSIEDNEYYTPTQSLLQKWLREKQSLFVFVFANTYENNEEFDNPDTKEDFIKPSAYYYQINLRGCNIPFKTYEEALEVGLYAALRLIK